MSDLEHVELAELLTDGAATLRRIALVMESSGDGDGEDSDEIEAPPVRHTIPPGRWIKAD